MQDLEIGMPLVLKERSERGGNVTFIGKVSTSKGFIYKLLTDWGNEICMSEPELEDYVVPLWYQEHLEICEGFGIANILKGEQYLKDSIKGRIKNLQEALIDLEADK